MSIYSQSNPYDPSTGDSKSYANTGNCFGLSLSSPWCGDDTPIEVPLMLDLQPLDHNFTTPVPFGNPYETAMSSCLNNDNCIGVYSAYNSGETWTPFELPLIPNLSMSGTMTPTFQPEQYAICTDSTTSKRTGIYNCITQGNWTGPFTSWEYSDPAPTWCSPGSQVLVLNQDMAAIPGGFYMGTPMYNGDPYAAFAYQTQYGITGPGTGSNNDQFFPFLGPLVGVTGLANLGNICSNNNTALSTSNYSLAKVQPQPSNLTFNTATMNPGLPPTAAYNTPDFNEATYALPQPQQQFNTSSGNYGGQNFGYPLSVLTSGADGVVPYPTTVYNTIGNNATASNLMNDPTYMIVAAGSGNVGTSYVPGEDTTQFTSLYVQFPPNYSIQDSLLQSTYAINGTPDCSTDPNNAYCQQLTALTTTPIINTLSPSNAAWYPNLNQYSALYTPYDFNGNLLNSFGQYCEYQQPINSTGIVSTIDPSNTTGQPGCSPITNYWQSGIYNSTLGTINNPNDGVNFSNMVTAETTCPTGTVSGSVVLGGVSVYSCVCPSSTTTWNPNTYTCVSNQCSSGQFWDNNNYTCQNS